MLRALFVVAFLAAVLAGTAETSVSPPAWSESHAESVLLSRLRLPCANVREPAGCNKQRAMSTIAAIAKQEQRCEVLAPADADAFKNGKVDVAAIGQAFSSMTKAQQSRFTRCMDQLGSLQSGRDPEETLSRIATGFPIDTADCIGTGEPDVTGFRFYRFRCKVTVSDVTASNQDTLVSGRLGVTVTGKSTFRWLVI